MNQPTNLPGAPPMSQTALKPLETLCSWVAWAAASPVAPNKLRNPLRADKRQSAVKQSGSSSTDIAADQERYKLQIKTSQIRETINLAAHSAITHIAVAVAIYWLWQGNPRAFLAPFCLFVFLTEAVVLIGKNLFERVEPTQRVVELACRCAEGVALFQGLVWGSMPIALLNGIDPDHRVLLVAISAGLIGGVFVFGSLTRITIIYMVPLVGGSFIGLLTEHKPISSLVAVLLAIYALFVLTSVLRLNRLAAHRILSQLRVADQRETIGLLLNDFEQNTSEHETVL